MSLFAVLAALSLEFWRPERPDQPRRRAGEWMLWLLLKMNAGGEQHGVLAWTLGVLLPALAVAAVGVLLGGLWQPLAWGLDVVVLYFCLGFKCIAVKSRNISWFGRFKPSNARTTRRVSVSATIGKSDFACLSNLVCVY